MPKANIKYTLHNKNEKKFFSNEISGITTLDEIKFYDNGVKVNINLDSDTIVLERKSDEYHIKMIFKLEEETIGYYKVLSLGEFELKVKTNYITRKDNNIEIDYQMSLDNGKWQKFNYVVVYEEVLGCKEN